MKNNKMVYLLMSVVVGLLAFTMSGLMACYVIWKLNNYIIATLITGGLGTLLFSVLLMLKDKIVKMTIAGFFAKLIGLFLSFGIIEGIVYILPKVGIFFEGSIIPDIAAIAVIALIYGLIVGLAGYGKKAMWLFALISALVAIPFGMLVVFLNSNSDIQEFLTSINDILGQFDLNFLSISIALGVGLGLSNGLYNMSVKKPVM